MSSEIRHAKRVSTLFSVMLLDTSFKSCHAEPSRNMAYMPRRILARASSALVDSWQQRMPEAA